MNGSDPASVETRSLEAEDSRWVAQANQRLGQMQTIGIWLSAGLGLGACYMGHRGFAGDAVACIVGSVLLAACAIGLSRAKARDAGLATKDVITGVIRRRIRFESQYNAYFRFDVGGLEVVGPANVFDEFQEGQTVQIERLTGSHQFLRIRATDE